MQKSAAALTTNAKALVGIVFAAKALVRNDPAFATRSLALIVKQRIKVPDTLLARVNPIAALANTPAPAAPASTPAEATGVQEAAPSVAPVPAVESTAQA